jgi:transcriptional regulator with XRE-family HTH domain
MKSSDANSALPLPVRRALKKLGGDISAARRRREISTPLMAERALISRMTLYRAERGDPGVSIGVYATLLFVLGLTDRVSMLADASADPVGMRLAEEQLPKRIRRQDSI